MQKPGRSRRLGPPAQVASNEREVPTDAACLVNLEVFAAAKNFCQPAVAEIWRFK